MSATTHFGLDLKRLDADAARARATLMKIKADAVPKATAKALNRTMDRTRTAVVRELSGLKGVPAKFLRTRVKPFPATYKTLSASVWIGTKLGILVESLPGARLLTTGKAKGSLKAGRISVKPFKAKMPSGHVGLFVRRAPGLRRTRGRPVTSSANLPIERPMVRLTPEARDILDKHAATESRVFLPAEAARLFKFELSKHTKGV